MGSVTLMAVLRLWLRRSDHYDLLGSHLQARGMARLTRGMIALIAACLAVTAYITTLSPTGPRGAVALGCVYTASVGASMSAVIWLRGWPTRRSATAFTVLADVSIALVALAQSHPSAGVIACTTFATMAIFIALFQTAPAMMFHLMICAAVAGFQSVRLAMWFGWAAAVCSFAVVLLLNLVAPFGIQVVVHMLGADAVLAENDQLTGLLTRLAFGRRAMACLENSRQRRGHVVVTVVDLDRFKQLNDSLGHSVGDQALISVARALRDVNADSAVIGRSGGEEFVIADVWRPDQISDRAQLICDVIAALPFGVTASVGTAGIYPRYRSGSVDEVLSALVEAADTAMYVAKRRGGNQAAHHEWPLPQPLVGPEDDTGFRDGISA